MNTTIVYEVKQSVAWITLNRPEKLNSFNEVMHRELLQALQEANENEAVRAIVLTGAGRAFSAGQDLGAMDDAVDYGEHLRTRYNPIVEQMAHMKKPTIAAVNGTAAGAGFSLALAADFRLVAENASFLNAFIHIGLVPDSGNTYYLPRMIGHAKALELMLLGEKVTAQQAKELGLVTKLLASEVWEEEVATFAEKLAKMPTKTMAIIKESVQSSWQSNLPEVLEQEAIDQQLVGQSKDHHEGVQAFIEKRSPQFIGK